MNRNFLLTSAAIIASGIFGYALYPIIAKPSSREIIGRIEYAIFEDYALKFKSRIDTGAGVSSINGKILEVIPPENKDDPEKLKFKVTDSFGKTKILTHRIIEWNNIKKKGGEGVIRRPTVLMDIRLGGVLIEARVNIADRSDFLYPFLVGRNVLKAGDFLVDPEQSFMRHPRREGKRSM